MELKTKTIQSRKRFKRKQITNKKTRTKFKNKLKNLNDQG